MLWLVVFVVSATRAELRNNGNNPKNGSEGWMEQLKLQLMRNNYDYEPSSEEPELPPDSLDGAPDVQGDALTMDNALDGPQYEPQSDMRVYVYDDATTSVDGVFAPRHRPALTSTDIPSRRENDISRNDLLYYVDDARLALDQPDKPHPSMNRLDALDDRFKSLDNRLRLPDNGLASLNNRLRSPDNSLDSPDKRLDSLNTRLKSLDNRLRSPKNRQNSLNNPLKSLDDRLGLPDNRQESLDNRLKSLDNRLHSPDNRLDSLDNRLRPPDTRLDWLDNHLNSLDNLVRSPDNSLDSLNKRLASLDNQLTSPNNRLGSLDNQLASLENRLRSSDHRQDSVDRNNRREMNIMSYEDDGLDNGNAVEDPQKKVSYKLLKLPNKSRRDGRGPRFVEERGEGGVALLSLDGAPFPEFRLPSQRRQYRADPLSDTERD